ncbi:MAG: AmmeMemoRadiSam system protein B [Gammaproteobacteria bacterium]
MERVRTPAVAGTFYPANAAQLRESVDRYLAHADSAGEPPKALIAPHAGYIYSGPVAASVYAQLRDPKAPVERVVLLGPAHRLRFEGLAAPGVRYFATPLGEVELDEPAIERVCALPFVDHLPQAHESEHSLEVQLPFLQIVLGEFKLVPLLVGDATGTQVAQVLETLWGGAETLIVISSDLSHFLDYETARDIDARTSQAIIELRGDDIGFEQACGRLPVQGLLEVARRRHLRGSIVDLRNSGDTAGSMDRVVGYGAYAFR